MNKEQYLARQKKLTDWCKEARCPYFCHECGCCSAGAYPDLSREVPCYIAVGQVDYKPDRYHYKG